MVDITLMALISGKLHIGLALRTHEKEPFFNTWTVPGGMVRPDEDADAEATARRVLRDKAGVVSPYLEQLYTFTGATRDSRGWSASIAYYALVRSDIAPADSEVFRWVAVDSLGSLPFDHSKIVQAALDRVRSKAGYSALAVHLAPPEFTMTALRTIYEQVLGGTIPPRTFERYMEMMDILEPTGEMKSAGGKPGKVYRVKKSQGLAQFGPSLLTK